MPQPRDYFTVTLSDTHANWGGHRYTDTRPPIPNEHFIPIPRAEAERLGIFMSNYTDGVDTLGINIFEASSSDGLFKDTVKAQGNSRANDIYAKQFSVKGNLKGFHNWFTQANIGPGTQIKVEWLTPNEILFTKI